MEKWSFWYEVIKYYLRFVFHIFYRKVKVTGVENVPLDKAVIFAPNHQNALMDPLAIIFTNKLQTVFLTRADIFKKPLLLKIFTFMKMLPVYRVRDGVDSLANNDEIFKKSVDILLHKKSMSLFPEGQHNNKMFLLPLKKAVPRIAFMAEESTGFQSDVHIIPVGIYYDNYTDSDAYIRINYGKPIRTKEYQALYEENSQKCWNVLKNDISDAMKLLMVDVKDHQNYSLYIQICNILWSERKIRKGKDKFDFYKETTEKLISVSTDTDRSLSEIEANIEKFNLMNIKKLPEFYIHPNDFFSAFYSAFILIFLLPFFIYGAINHIVYYVLLQWFIKKTFKDKQFHSSVKFVIAAVVFPILYIIHFIVFYNISDNISLSLLYFISLPLSGWLANKYKTHFSIWIFNLKWFFSPIKSKLRLLKVRREIIKQTIQIL